MVVMLITYILLNSFPGRADWRMNERAPRRVAGTFEIVAVYILFTFTFTMVKNMRTLSLSLFSLIGLCLISIALFHGIDNIIDNGRRIHQWFIRIVVDMIDGLDSIFLFICIMEFCQEIE